MSMVWITGQTLVSGTTLVSFAGIPQTFTHLQARISTRSAVGVAAHDLNMTTNTQSGSNMTGHILQGDGASATSTNAYGNPSTVSQVSWVPGSTSTTNVFGSVVIDVLDYASTSKNKTFRTIGGYDASGSGVISLNSGMVMSTGAITTLSWFVGGGGGNMVAGSRFDLYGITTSATTGA
jgi:hypothetical protein